MVAALGYFGKFPGLGDFVRGGDISRRFVTAWDDFLQQGFLASRAALGDGWMDAYQTAPIWRFALGRGVIEAGVYTGVMMPSQDAVGRLFPLTIVRAGLPPLGGLADDGYYLPLEDAALAMLDSLRSKPDLEMMLEGGAAPDGTAPVDDGVCDWLSAPGAEYGTPLALQSTGLPTPAAFATLLTQDTSTWVGTS